MYIDTYYSDSEVTINISSSLSMSIIHKGRKRIYFFFVHWNAEQINIKLIWLGSIVFFYSFSMINNKMKNGRDNVLHYVENVTVKNPVN